MKDIRVLVVEDDPKWLSLLVQIVSSSGYGCAAANSFRRAKEIISAHRIELVIVDYTMGELDSEPDLVEWIADNAIDTKIILYSGYLASMREVFRYGQVVHFWLKDDLRRSELITCIREVLEA